MTILFQHLLRQAPSVLGLSIGPHQAAVELRVLHTKTLHGIGDASLPMYSTNFEKVVRKATSVSSSNVLLSLLVSFGVGIVLSCLSALESGVQSSDGFMARVAL
jgi:hypothetical protein